MSWQAYVDTSLLATKKINHAAIFSGAGDSVWAASPEFKVEPKEVKDLISGFDKDEPLYSDGIHISKTKYICILANKRSIYGKKGKEGIVAVKTKQAIIVARYPDTVQPGEAAKVVEQLADYLIGVGY